MFLRGKRTISPQPHVTGPASPVIQDYGAIMEEHKTNYYINIKL
ncbi:hypothetical protein [Pontibacillus yanchengensis]|nr:hypothetical protein [Pontibacillus yanchengensis]